MNKHDYLLDKVAVWLYSKGLQRSNEYPRYGHLKPDMVLQNASRQLIVEAKVANAYRSQVFPALIGDVILRAKHVVGQADILIALLISQINDKAVEDLQRYAQEFFPELNWFLIDESGLGRACLYGQLLEISVDAFSVDYSSHHRGVSRRILFSSNNQWLLKMLLLPGINPRFWGGPSDKPKSAMELSNAAHVPQSSVSAFLRKFENESYIRRIKGVPVVVRHRELLDDWFYAVKKASIDRIPVRHMYGDSPEDLLHKICQNPKNPDVIIGYHMACHLYGIGRSNVKVGVAYACHPVQQIMRSLDLVEDQSSSPSLWLDPGKDKIVQRSFVMINGIPVCDILQCYLDVRGSSARGQEQADYILDNVLMPNFERRF